MSGLVLNEQLVNKTVLPEKAITIKRIRVSNVGTRLWFVILTEGGEYFQRWSSTMNNFDEILITSEPGDVLTITYLHDFVSDPVSKLFDDFERKIIFEVKSIN
jgi:hypothetical protein